jgi:hypothetical protein
MILEPKSIVKQKIGYSPDNCDSAALTFAEPITRKPRGLFVGQRPGFESDYDPMAAEYRAALGRGGDDGYSPAGGRGVPSHWIPHCPPR